MYNLISDTGSCICELMALNTPFSDVGIKEYCDTCEDASVNVNMSLDYYYIKILFYNEIKIVGLEGTSPYIFSNKLCQHILQFLEESFYGLTPRCKLENAGKTITIELGYGSKILPNELVEIKPDVIQFNIGDCNGMPIQ